jgi:hypothetical protein
MAIPIMTLMLNIVRHFEFSVKNIFARASSNTISSFLLSDDNPQISFNQCFQSERRSVELSTLARLSSEAEKHESGPIS